MTTLEPTGQQAGPRHHRDRWAVVALVLLALVPIAISAAFGAYGLARNDDWAWAEILGRWEQTGVLRFNGWPSMFLIGHLALAWPIGRLFPDSLPRAGAVDDHPRRDRRTRHVLDAAELPLGRPSGGGDRAGVAEPALRAARHVVHDGRAVLRGPGVLHRARACARCASGTRSASRSSRCSRSSSAWWASPSASTPSWHPPR